MMNMISNAVSIPEVKQGQSYPLGETAQLILDDVMSQRFKHIDSNDPKEVKRVLDLKNQIERKHIKGVARKLNINFSETQRYATILKNLNSRMVTVLDSDRGLDCKFDNIHESAFKGALPFGYDSRRQVRQPEGQRSDNKDMNQRGRAGAYTRNLDKGLHLEDRYLCDCGTTFHIGSTVCRECGTKLNKSVHKTVKRPTTTNHTQHAEHMVVFMTSDRNLKVGVRRVEFQKSGRVRTKAGKGSRTNEWTSGKWVVMMVEGHSVERRFGLMMIPMRVFVTDQCRVFIENQGGEE